MARRALQFVRSTDSDIDSIAVNSEVTTVNKAFVLSHPPLAMDVFPNFLVGGIAVTIGTVGSGSDYEGKRVGETQTIIKRKTTEAITVSQPLGIGQMAIGSTFKIH